MQLKNIERTEPLEEDASHNISQSTEVQKKGTKKKVPIWCKNPTNSEGSLQIWQDLWEQLV